MSSTAATPHPAPRAQLGGVGDGGLGVPRRAENFPLAWLCGADLRRARIAVYNYCRLVDDLGDELRGDRLAALDAALSELRAAAGGTARHPTFAALTPLFRDRGLPLDPFAALIEANRHDQCVTEYASWEELDAYCDLSAAPVGEIVLRLEGAATPDRLLWSSRACAGLQLANHWQDLREDALRGRCYVPRGELERFGLRVDDLAAGRAGPALDGLLRVLLDATRARLRQGWPLVGSLHGRLRAEVAGFIACGEAATRAVERAGAGSLERRASAGRPGYALAALVGLRALVAPAPLPAGLRRR